MHFGAFAPLPLRVGEYGVTAEQYCRLAGDAVAAVRSAPLAVVRACPGGFVSDSPAVVEYLGRNGVGLEHAPTVTEDAGGLVLTWTATYEDELGHTVAWNITDVEVFAEPDAVYPLCAFGKATAPNVCWGGSVIAADGTSWDAYLVFVAYGTVDLVVDDYGAGTDKINCTTERTPYAAQSYRQIQNLLGSAYSKELTGIVHSHNFADARQYGWLRRLTEKLSCEMDPGTSDARLAKWCTLLAVPWRSGDRPSVLRSRCVAAMRRFLGPTRQVVDDAIAELLGDWYVTSWRQWPEDLSDPPDLTYWPTTNPGPSQWDIGGGCWMSERNHLVVEVKMPPASQIGEFLTLMNVDLYQLLDKLLPAQWTFGWSVGSRSGFVLDTDSLDYAGLGWT